MLANRKRSRDVLHDFNNSVDVEDNELELVSSPIEHKFIHLISIFDISFVSSYTQQPTTKRRSFGWFSSRLGRFAGRVIRGDVLPCASCRVKRGNFEWASLDYINL